MWTVLYFEWDKNKNCFVCNKKLDINKYKKDRTVCKDWYNKKKRKNNLIQNEITTSHQQPKIENGNNNNNGRTLLVGPSFFGKTEFDVKNSFTKTKSRYLYNHQITSRTIFQF